MIVTHDSATDFAPPMRASEEDLERQQRQLLETQYLPMLFDAVDEMILVLNRERQIVFANNAFKRVVDARDVETVCGLRVGEALDCIHSAERESGCGTTKFCAECGAARAILQSAEGGSRVEECRITRKGTGEALDLRVHAAPLTLGGYSYTVFSLRDISSEKRRQVLEQMFFHDLLNTATLVRGLAEVFGLSGAARQEEFRNKIVTGAQRLVEEIASQKMLLAAEQGELVCSTALIDTLEFVKRSVSGLKELDLARGRELVLAPESVAAAMSTDQGLLSRVLGNMIKNALEASQPGERIVVGCAPQDGGARFWVTNAAVMPRSVQLQVFQRSFTTKGTGRGVGTYSMKMLAERYLKGRVGFVSAQGSGTTFEVWLPSMLPSP
ncbi:MAG: histidine kinase [Candidatus Wallbacteria bacterium]|nr:histidine kinase [Candidatus Wallbacteria bacterium]